MKKTLYGIYHSYEYGYSMYLVKANHEPLVEEVVKACRIDFEPDRDGYIDIEPMGKPIEI